MTGGFLDWLGRAVMLSLAGLVTLSIIGSIAAIPSGSLESRMGLETQRATAELPQAPGPTSEGLEPKAGPTEVPDGQLGRGTAEAAHASAAAPSDAARWLEAITYALLALVGLAALASLILWRGLRERRRIAEALETLAARS